MGKVTWKHIIVYKLFVLDRDIWNHTIVYKLFILDRNTWYHIIVQTQAYKQIEKCNFKKCNG